MLVKTKGIVFRTIKYSETSIITDIFTRERGLRSFIVNGIRKSKPRFSHALFQIMSQIDLLAYDHRHNLNRIKEISWDYAYSEIPFNIIKSSIGIFMTELCQKAIKEKETNRPMYDFLSNWFIYLDQCKTPFANIHLLFMIEFSAMLGFQPMNNYHKEGKPYFNLKEGYFIHTNLDEQYTMDRRSSQNFSLLLNTNKENLDSIKLSREARSILINYLINFYQLHIENFPKLKSVDVLSEVLR